MLDLPPNLLALETAWVALLGAVLGSFLNVVIARVPVGQSVVRPRSRCPGCQAEIAWYDNLPVLSWILLRARCRACGTRISARYPLVELLGAGAALLAFGRHGLSGAAAAELAFVLLLLALGLIDLDTWLLPHLLTRSLIALGLLCAALGAAAAPDLRQAVYGAALGFVTFAGLSVLGEKVFGREALGFGDVWLLAGLGAFLGVKALLPVILLASVQGTVVGAVLAMLGKLPKGEEGATPAADPTSTPTPTPTPPSTPPSTPTATPTATATATAPSTPTATPTSTPTATPTSTDATIPTSTNATIPTDAAPAEEEEDWVPPRNAVPFGPFLVAGALEWLYLGEALARAVPLLETFR